jgi:hypothetical protein
MARMFSEAELRIPALKVMEKSANGFLPISDLVAELAEVLKPEGKAAMSIPGGSDTYFSQKVRKLVCHRSASASLQKKGFAVYRKDRDGIEITIAGRAYLKSIGAEIDKAKGQESSNREAEKPKKAPAEKKADSSGASQTPKNRPAPSSKRA